MTITRQEATPNPNARKFVLSREAGEPLPPAGATRSFRTREQARADPLAARLFQVPGVEGVLFGAGWLTVNKSPDADWRAIRVGVERALLG